ncbi:hypothetical protein K523DRAFT_343881 [Schizophyllum commune Tattone D]|nr:hypothetical protein K523DRAFT_343881 [Schizophyllum commune Tattone D]
MSATPSALESLAPELIARICGFCDAQNLQNFANTCRTMLYVARAIRWRRITVKDDRYFEFREWLLLEERRKLIALAVYTRAQYHCRHSPYVFARNLRTDFHRYIRTLIFPSDWTKDTIALVRLLAAIAPRNLTSIVLGKHGRATWYVGMKDMWTTPTMDAFLAPVLAMTIFNAPREGLHFLFSRVPPSVGKPMSALLKDVKIKASFIVTNSWTDSTEPMGWSSGSDDDDLRVVMAADTLELDLREGIRDLVKFLYFPSLVELTLFTGRLGASDWQTVERLLSDCAAQLRTVRLYKGSHTASDTNFTTFYCLLTALSTVYVHWPLVHHLEGIHGLIFPGQVELVVENYDANAAEEEEYERAAPVLHLPHWRRVAFKYMLSPGSGKHPLLLVRVALTVI